MSKLGEEDKDIITFEHLNAHDVNPHDEFIELVNTMIILELIGAGMYNFN